MENKPAAIVRAATKLRSRRRTQCKPFWVLRHRGMRQPEPPRYPFQTKPHQVGTPSSPSDAPHHNGGRTPTSRDWRACVLFQRKLRSIRPPGKAGGHRGQVGLHRRHRAGGLVSRVLPDQGCSDGRLARAPVRTRRRTGRRLRRVGVSPARLHHARRSRDGQPLRSDVGPVPIHPLHRGREHEHPRLLLSVEQARSQLFPVPRNGQPGRRRRPRQYIQPVRQGVHGDHEPVLHPRRATRRQAHNRLFFPTMCSIPTSGCTGAPCSPSRTGTARSR